MDLDAKSKFVEMHQLTVLRQMLTFAREALALEATITLNADFSGHLEGEIRGGFNNIGEAVEIAKDQIKNHMAKHITSLSQQLKAHVEQTKELAVARDEWKALGEQVLEGKYEVPEKKPVLKLQLDRMLMQNYKDMKSRVEAAAMKEYEDRRQQYRGIYEKKK